MKLSFRLRVRKTGEFTEDYDAVMAKSDLDPRMGFEEIGIQGDGTAVIFDKCANFAYISDEYEIVVMLDAN